MCMLFQIFLIEYKSKKNVAIINNEYDNDNNEISQKYENSDKAYRTFANKKVMLRYSPADRGNASTFSASRSLKVKIFFSEYSDEFLVVPIVLFLIGLTFPNITFNQIILKL